MAYRNERGFSLLEMLTVISISMVLAGITFIALSPMLKKNNVDEAYATTIATIRNYHNQSVTQSKRFILTFSAPQTITVYYWGKNTVPPDPAPVQVASFLLPTDIQFAVQAGFPNPGPDSFGTGAAAVSMNTCAVLTQSCLVFMPDGSAQDDAGNFNNGIVYITRPGDLYSSRAVTVWGATGRARGWRLYPNSGNTWVQQ